MLVAVLSVNMVRLQPSWLLLPSCTAGGHLRSQRPQHLQRPLLSRSQPKQTPVRFIGSLLFYPNLNFPCSLQGCSPRLGYNIVIMESLPLPNLTPPQPCISESSVAQIINLVQLTRASLV